VQGNKSQSIFAVKTSEMGDLSPAEVALAIVENDVRRGLRQGQVVFDFGRMAHEWELF
jgi:hypothetical protein